MVTPPTGIVTFLHTDIEGSTAMWERHPKAMQAALARHDEILRTIMYSHEGYVFKMVGDACWAAFSEAPWALEAALSAQRAIFSEPWGERCKVLVRIALYTGEAEERGGDYVGPPLNRVSRLLSSGHGGQSLLSRSTEERVRDRLPEGVDLRNLGERRLKDLKEPERIFQLLAPDLPSEFPPLKTLEASSEDDRYRLIKQVGSGGMAEVYLAYDEVLEREVAFKILDRKHAENREAVERFRREARSAASLRHPNIVSIHDRGHTEDGAYNIVMEYMEGGTLEDLIEREGPLPPQRATEIALQVAKALSAAHERGVIHRDIKPQNILLSESGEAKVTDFGIARATSATTMTRAGSVLGTVHYISPEQARGEPTTARSDLYSLGVVLYERLTGELPYDAESSVGVVMKHIGEQLRPPRKINPDLPGSLNAITVRLLAKEPMERYPEAAELIDDLERARGSLERRVSRDSSSTASWLLRLRDAAGVNRRRLRLLVSGALVAAIVVLGIAALTFSMGDESAAERPVPPLVGKTLEEAKQSVGDDFEIVGGENALPNQVVLIQRPPAGEKVERGSEISVTVGECDERCVTVPDLKGNSEAEAREALESADLVLGNVHRRPSDGVPKGQIISQNPPPGSQWDAHDLVSVTISTG